MICNAGSTCQLGLLNSRLELIITDINDENIWISSICSSVADKYPSQICQIRAPMLLSLSTLKEGLLLTRSTINDTAAIAANFGSFLKWPYGTV